MYEKRNAVYSYQISLFVPQIFWFLKYANYPSDGVTNSTEYWSAMMKKYISANLYQKCLIHWNEIQLHVLHNTSIPVFLPWKHTGFQTSLILKAFLAAFGVVFWYLPRSLIREVQQAYKYVRSSFWPFKMFFEHKIIKNNEIRLGRLEWNEFPWESNCYSSKCVAWRTIPPPSFSGLCLKIDRDSSTCILDVTLSWVNDVISRFNCIFCTHFKLNISGTNVDNSKP